MGGLFSLMSPQVLQVVLETNLFSSEVCLEADALADCPSCLHALAGPPWLSDQDKADVSWVSITSLP